MGFDVSYHPISEQEMEAWYFQPLEWMRAGDADKVRQLAEASGMEPFYIDKYLHTLQAGVQTTADELFDKSHSFYLAVVQGFFRNFYYIRGGAFTFLLEKDPAYRAYTKSWPAIWRKPWPNESRSQLVENYCGGVYLPPEQVVRLLNDHDQDARVRQDLEEQFSYGRIDVFLKALRAAKEQGVGLLEATEVVEPDPFDPNNSSCYSDLFHCDTDGVLLYIEAAQAQLAEAMQQDKK